MHNTQSSLPSINGVYRLDRPYGTVVIKSCNASDIRFAWFSNNVRQSTLMPLQNFYELNPVKTGDL